MKQKILSINVNMKICFFVMCVGIALTAIGYLYLDRLLALEVKALPHNIIYIFSFLTLGGDSNYMCPIYGAIGIFFLLCPYMRNNNPRAYQGWIFGCGLFGFSSIIVHCMKIFFGRPRPTLYISQKLYGFPFLGDIKHNLFHESYYSFPSGHVQTASSIGIGLMIMFPKLRPWMILYIITVMASRIIELKHYLSDVCATIVISMFLVIFQFYFIKKIYNQRA